jgi:DNA-binding XRE family transcriptional regulator
MKIKNDRQMANAEAELVRISVELEKFRNSNAGPDQPAEVLQAMIGALELDARELSDSISEYARVKELPVDAEFLGALSEDPGGDLVRARIALRMTHRELAEKVGVNETQIHRYETTNYDTAKLPRIIAIAKALRERAVTNCGV